MGDAKETKKPARETKAKQRPVPLSEDQRKLHIKWSREDCIAHLKAIAEANPEKVITRNFFRVNSDISESTWNRYFGTFEEFKRAAGIILSRHAHRLEKAIAKHDSVELMRQLNVDKGGWEDAYRKPSGRRWKTGLVGSDIHDRDCDPFWRRLFVDTARRVQPDVIFLNGDVFDLPEFSKYTQDPREWDPVSRIAWVHDFLAELREACPDSEIILLEGNHEFRLLRHLAEATPALRTILADLHGFTVPKLLGLEKYEVNFVARADLKAFTERDIKAELRKNWLVLWDSVLGHHFPEGRQMGYPGWNGHHHKHLVWAGYNPTHGAYEWHQIGAGHRREAEYCEGEKWSNGFLLVHCDTERRRSQFEYVQIQDFAVIGGRWYERQPEEFVTAL